MEDWQKRVIAERDELREKITRLDAYIAHPACLDAELLKIQRAAMGLYVDILEYRISRFPVHEASE